MTGRLVVLALALAAVAPASAQDARAKPAPTTASFKLPSAALGRERSVHVYTPAGYAAGSARYPVLYVLDGGIDQIFPHVAALVDAMTASGEVRPLIVVGIASENREREFAQRQSASFRTFVAAELKPWIDARYRTSGEDALSGSSLSGLFVVETLLREPAPFDDYIAASPSMWWNGYALALSARGLLQRQPAGERRLWLSLANEGRGMGVERLVAALEKRAPASLRWTYAPLPEETHQSIYLPVMRDAIRAFYPAGARAEAAQ